MRAMKFMAAVAGAALLIPAATTASAQNACADRVSRYTGTGDPNDAESFACGR
jgi:hypothetical protein